MPFAFAINIMQTVGSQISQTRRVSLYIYVFKQHSDRNGAAQVYFTQTAAPHAKPFYIIV